jgi:putative hydrolase
MHPPCYKGEKTVEEVTRAYINVMEREDIDIIGHPDDGRFPVDYEELVKAAKRTGTLLEINNSSLKPDGYRANSKENAKKMLEYCKKYEAMIVLGSDSHFDDAIAEYPYAEEVLKEADFPQELIANTSLEKLQALLKRNKK